MARNAVPAQPVVTGNAGMCRYLRQIILGAHPLRHHCISAGAVLRRPVGSSNVASSTPSTTVSNKASALPASPPIAQTLNPAYYDGRRLWGRRKPERMLTLANATDAYRRAAAAANCRVEYFILSAANPRILELLQATGEADGRKKVVVGAAMPLLFSKSCIALGEGLRLLPVIERSPM